MKLTTTTTIKITLLAVSVILASIFSAPTAQAQVCQTGGNVISCLEVRNDRTTARSDEVAFSGVAIPASVNLLTTDLLEVVDLVGTPVPAQIRVLARWGGTVDNNTRPIRWLEVALQDQVASQTTNSYQLRLGAAPPLLPTGPLTVTDQGGGIYSVDTGAAVFVIDGGNPALLSTVTVGADQLYAHSAGAGPRLDIAGAVLDTAGPGEVVVDPGTFMVLETGPLKAVFVIQGHFVDPAGSTLCDEYEPGLASYQALGFTAVLSLTRGTRHVDLKVEVRNECLDAQFGPFPGGDRTIDRASWELPLSLGGTSHYYGASGVVTAADGDVFVEQRKGAGNPWARRARVVDNAVDVVTSQTVDRPFVAIAGSAGAASAQMAWMRFREPQALAATGSTLSLLFVSEPLQVGGAKGIWNMARVTFADVPAGPGDFEPQRAEGEAFLERGLLVLNRRDTLNAAGVFASLGTDASTLVKSDYATHMNLYHDATVGPGGQHEMAKTFGSQLWPDTQGATWGNANNPLGPLDNPGGQNYWNTSGAELLELLRTGDPKWAWDLALPLTWQQLISAYVNKGENSDGFKNGYALNSPTCGDGAGSCAEGQWYRHAVGSDDYTYTSGHVGYAVRPCYLIQRRFAAAGTTTIARYGIPRAQQVLREETVSQVDLTRQVIQHFVQLANCAEFVPGAEGQACHDRLIAVVTELSEENMSSGLMCQADVQPANPSRCMPNGGNPALDWCDCVEPQRFIANSLISPFLHRMLLNYGDLGGNLQSGLATSYWHLYRAGLGLAGGPTVPADPQRPALPEPDDWLSQPGWETGVTPFVIQDVDVVDGNPNTTDPSGDMANLILEPNKPHTAAWFMIATGLDPSLDLCGVSRTAMESQFFLDAWDAYDNLGGWSKGPAQVMQTMVFGVGLYDECGSGGGNSTPQVVITAPVDATTVGSGSQVVFTATATDTEDGDLSAAVVWTSDQDGVLGAGNSVTVALSDGSHTVTAQATDSGAAVGSAQVTITVGSGSGQGLVLDETFDAGSGAWTLGGLWHVAGASSGCAPVSASGASSAYFGRDTDCDYDTGAQEAGDLVSPQISGINTDSSLTFNFRREVELEPSATVDMTEVHVRPVGGAWVTVWTRNSQDASVNSWSSSGAIELDDALAGQSIEVRFHFDSDDNQFNDFLGWMIDDVQVTGTVAVGCGGIFCDGFEGGNLGTWSSSVP